MQADPQSDSSARWDLSDRNRGLIVMHRIQVQQNLLIASVDRVRGLDWAGRGGLRPVLNRLGKCHRRHAYWFHFRYLELGGAEPPSAAVGNHLAPLPPLPSQVVRSLLRPEWRLQRDLAWRCHALDRRTRRLVRCHILPQLGEVIDDFLDALRVASRQLEPEWSTGGREAA